MRTLQVDEAGPGQWVESTGTGWGQTKRGGAWVKDLGRGSTGKGEGAGKGRSHPREGMGGVESQGEWEGVVPPESLLTPCLSLYPSLRDGAHSHPLPHGQSLPSVHSLRHQ